jgi:hypothetical protein
MLQGCSDTVLHVEALEKELDKAKALYPTTIQA